MVKKFDEQDELGQKVAHDVASKGKVLKRKGEIEQQEALDLSKLIVPKRKLLALASSIAQFQEHTTIGQREVDDDVSEFKVLNRKVSAQTTSLTGSQAHSENKI